MNRAGIHTAEDRHTKPWDRVGGLRYCAEYMEAEDVQTNYVDIGPVNKVGPSLVVGSGKFVAIRPTNNIVWIVIDVCVAVEWKCNAEGSKYSTFSLCISLARRCSPKMPCRALVW